MALNLQPDVERQEYILLTGEIIFLAQEGETPNAIRLNTVVQSKDGRVSLAHIGRAQQALQMQFFKRMEDPSLKVIDVVILTIFRLGQFTPEEFNKAPEGMAIREMEKVEGNA